MKEWYEQRRITISALELKFLIQLLEEKVKACEESIELCYVMLKTERDTEQKHKLENTIAEERRRLIVVKGFLRRFRGVLVGKKKRLRQIEAIVCHSLIS